jgi:hypothetical protein
MKKSVLFLLVLLVLTISVSALAAGKIRVTQENFVVAGSYSKYAYVYARLDNVGDKPIKVNAAILEVFDEDGNPITSTDSLREYAEYLQPGEYTYAYMSTKVEDADVERVDDYLLTVTGKSDKNYISLRLPVETKYEPDVPSWYGTEDYMCATVTNNTGEPIYSIEVVLVLLDEEGNILFMDNGYMGSDKAIMPGSSITVRKEVSSSFKEIFTKEGIKPHSVDAIAFVNVSQ